MKKDVYDYEEEFHQKDRKAFRKERQIARSTDRSKFKKTDQKKQRLKYFEADAKRGRVLAISGEKTVVDIENKHYFCSLRGSLKKEKTKFKNIIAVGDIVGVKVLGENQGQILFVEERTSFLERVDSSGKKRQLIASNIDQVFITTSLLLPPFKPFLIDRYMIAAKKGNMEPVIVINKVDLLKDTSEDALQQKILYEEFLHAYSSFDVSILSISCKAKKGLAKLKKKMQNKLSVFSGQSGVGKSSLINLLLNLNLPIGDIAKKTSKGIHTTSKAELIPLEDGGFCIDTPGIKSFGLWDLKKEDIMNHFLQIQKIGSECKYPNCFHLEEPHCKVKQCVKAGEISTLIYESYATLIQEVLEESFLQ